MSVCFGIVMDFIVCINFKKDSLFVMLLVVQVCGWLLFYMEQQDFYQKVGVVCGCMCLLKVFNDVFCWFELEVESD